MSDSVVLCEGYHDRAFWKGWLARLGCAEARTAIVQRSPGNKQIAKGEYDYRAVSGRIIRVIPCGGKRLLMRAARVHLGDRGMSPGLERLVINVDADTALEATDTGVTGLSPRPSK